MNRRRGIARASGRHHGVRRGRNAHERRAQGLFDWLAIASLLLYGWLPIVLQIHLVAPEVSGHGHHAKVAEAAPAADLPGEGRECPLFHSAICLCAAFVKLLATSGPSVRGAASAARRRRGRFLASRLSRTRPALLFAARAPPVSG
jgi:hypothetical protein